MALPGLDSLLVLDTSVLGYDPMKHNLQWCFTWVYIPWLLLLAWGNSSNPPNFDPNRIKARKVLRVGKFHLFPWTPPQSAEGVANFCRYFSRCNLQQIPYFGFYFQNCSQFSCEHSRSLMKVAFVRIVLSRVRLTLAVLFAFPVFRVLLMLFHCSQNQKHKKKKIVWSCHY